jgi:eukaryotic-like serine/threonine-protein kinase
MAEAEILFDRYQLHQRIGAGGMGVVWRATDLLLDQPVALKRISITDADPDQAEQNRARALREARTAARLRRHPHVVAIYDIQVEAGDVWLVLEYLPSRNLNALRRERGRLDVAEVARIGARVADALAAGHAQGIEHRDVAPGNVLVAEDGTVKLTDFGISRLAGEEQITRENVISGTIAYLAPEVAATGESTPASDVFSLGSTLYAALEGEPPFGTDDNPVRLLNVVRTGIIRAPTSAGAFGPVLMRLLELDPATRPDAATAAELLDRFAQRATAATEVLAPETDAPEERPDSGRLLTPPTEPAPRRAGRARRPGRLEWRSTLSRRLLIALGVGLSLATAVIIAVVLFVAPPLFSGGGRDDAPVGAPALPATVGTVALAGDPKAADPCALLDPDWLRQFGTPWISGAKLPMSCAATISAPNNQSYWLGVTFEAPSSTPPSGEPQHLGGLTIVRQKSQHLDWATGCQNMLILTDGTRIAITATGAPGFNECRLTEVGTATAVNALARQGISYRPARTAGWAFATTDACTLLTDAEIRAAGADPNARNPGFANWSCGWGALTNYTAVGFRIDAAQLSNYGTPGTIAGHRSETHLDSGVSPHQCDVVVVTRPARSPTDNTELITAVVREPQPDQELCARASNLASAAVGRVPAGP